MSKWILMVLLVSLAGCGTIRSPVIPADKESSQKEIPTPEGIVLPNYNDFNLVLEVKVDVDSAVDHIKNKKTKERLEKIQRELHDILTGN